MRPRLPFFFLWALILILIVTAPIAVRYLASAYPSDSSVPAYQKNPPVYSIRCDLGDGYYLVKIDNGFFSSITMRLHHTELAEMREGR